MVSRAKWCRCTIIDLSWNPLVLVLRQPVACFNTFRLKMSFPGGGRIGYPLPT